MQKTVCPVFCYRFLRKYTIFSRVVLSSVSTLGTSGLSEIVHPNIGDNVLAAPQRSHSIGVANYVIWRLLREATIACWSSLAGLRAIREKSTSFHLACFLQKADIVGLVRQL